MINNRGVFCYFSKFFISIGDEEGKIRNLKRELQGRLNCILHDKI